MWQVLKPSIHTFILITFIEIFSKQKKKKKICHRAYSKNKFISIFIEIITNRMTLIQILSYL